MLAKLRKDALDARKMSVTVPLTNPGLKKDFQQKAALLSTVIAAAEAAAKADKQRPVTDADAGTAIRKVLKGVEDSIDLAKGPKLVALRAEAELLKSYLPVPLTGPELQNAIKAAASVAHVTPDLKAMKTIMGLLNTTYPGRVDGKLVSDMLKSGAVTV